MKLTITHLKAPWPVGAKVGDVLELPSVPVWALGKFKQADDDAEVTLVMPEAPAPSEQAAVVRDPLEELRAQAEAHFERMRADHTAELAELQGKLAAMAAERDQQAEELAAARAQLASSIEANGDKAQAEAEAQAAQERADASKKGKAK